MRIFQAYLGFIMDKDGRRPSSSKINTVVNMSQPKDTSAFRSFLGTVNYYLLPLMDEQKDRK